MKPAIFLDRDGVINKTVFSKRYNEYQPPHSIQEIDYYEDSIKSLKKLNSLDNFLIVISNQPDYAKGKTSLKNLIHVHYSISEYLEISGIRISDYFYCYHHPKGVVEDYTIKCGCRKPGTDFLDFAVKKFNLNLNDSWMIGDRESDILFGKNGGLKTIYINRSGLEIKNFSVKPDYITENLDNAVNIISGNH